MKKYISVLFLLCIISVTYAQERLIQGKVSILEKIPVAKARIKVMSTKQEVLTDTSGMFSVACNQKDKLKIYAHGFYTETAKLSENTKFVLINMKLRPGIKNQDYALGYGHVSDKERLHAIANLDNQTTDFSRYHNMFTLIQGQFPGVQILNNEIIIRGANSLNSSSSALIMLDGRQISLSTLETLYPGDVKSINVLKDASASLYGVQGGNGVIVITTRRGEQ